MAPTEVPDRAVRTLLDRWFPGGAVTFARMASGSPTPVYRENREDRVFSLRLAEHPGEVRDGEVRDHELAIQVGKNGPEVICWEAAPPELDRSAALTAAIPVSGWGWVDRVDDGQLVATHPDRTAWTKEYLAAVGIVAATGTYRGIIDPGEIRGGDRAYDLGDHRVPVVRALPNALPFSSWIWAIHPCHFEWSESSEAQEPVGGSVPKQIPRLRLGVTRGRDRKVGDRRRLHFAHNPTRNGCMRVLESWIPTAHGEQAGCSGIS